MILWKSKLEEDKFNCTIKAGIREFLVNSEGDFSSYKNDRYLTSTRKKGI